MSNSQINHTPADQMTKALESLRVIKLALACRNNLDDEDLVSLEYTLLEAMEDLRPIRELLEAHPMSWDEPPSTPPDTRDTVARFRQAA